MLGIWAIFNVCSVFGWEKAFNIRALLRKLDKTDLIQDHIPTHGTEYSVKVCR